MNNIDKIISDYNARRGDFLCEYDEQGYYVKATRLRKGEAK